MQDHGPHVRLLQLQNRQTGPEEVKIWSLVMDLTNPASRETALLELSKKREQYEDLALVLWHSFGSSHSPLGRYVDAQCLMSKLQALWLRCYRR